ncbi:MAG TPA: HAMP domain-containing sensor histidine kinase [Acidimicrobiia bacterium]|nr:HAMP domain-containing sensor histidine kinase [Acidimicrobiia bacterium]
MENFLDEYQQIRLVASVAGMVLVGVFVIGGWWQDGSPLPNLTALVLIAAHAGWCRLRRIRAPRAMLVWDTTLLGAIMLTIPDSTAVTTGTLAFLALLISLFTNGRWMIGLLAYTTAWYVAAYLSGVGVSAESVGVMTGGMLTVAAVVAVMISVRRWLGRLDAARSQMVGTVSHELRNNLTGVLGLTEVVATMADLEPAEARELVTMAHQQAVDANEIVEDLLTVSRLEGSALTTSREVVDVNEEVAATARRFQGTGTELGLALEEDLPPAWADPLRLRQTIRNLISNAIRYGGPLVVITTAQSGDAIEVTVRDNGDGVPTQDEATIFLPYRRSTQGRRDASSIGLGLWVCRQLAHAMGGHLVYRRGGGWTEFVLSIPGRHPGDGSTSENVAGSAARRSALAPTLGGSGSVLASAAA